MQLLEERIRRNGHVIGTDILKVDSFLNHQMDPMLFQAMAREWKHLFEGEGVNKILTIEASGIGIAIVAGLEFNCPVLFAKKSRGRNMAANVYSADVMSFTHNVMNQVSVSKEYLSAGDRVLLIDDFLANGAALSGLAELVRQAGGVVVGAGVAIEKAFEPGGRTLRADGMRVESLARVGAMSEENGVEFVH